MKQVSYVLMIDHIPDGKTVGTIDIFDFDPFHNRAGIGILIADEEYRTKGTGHRCRSNA